MDALVMCGGRGTRLDSSHEKPIHPIADVPMVDTVVSALEASRVGSVVAAVSPNTPETRTHLRDRDVVAVIETPGDGYVADLEVSLDHPDVSLPILTVVADLPLLAGETVGRILGRYERRSNDRQPGDSTLSANDESPSMTVCIPRALKRRIGVSLDSANDSHLVPTGVNVVGEASDDVLEVSYDLRLAVNVNSRTDAKLANRLVRNGPLTGDRP